MMSELADWRALSQKVIVVAVKRIPGEWCAYIKEVPGERHLDELAKVKKWGAKLPENIALACFPQFEGTPYAW